jgi:hypothetical protein
MFGIVLHNTCLEHHLEDTVPQALLHNKTSTPNSKGLIMADIHDVVNTVIYHALINQSGALVNTLQSLIKQIVEGMVHQEPNKGSQYFNASGYKGPQT